MTWQKSLGSVKHFGFSDREDFEIAYSTFTAFNGIFKRVNISVKLARHLFFVNIDAKVSQIFCSSQQYISPVYIFTYWASIVTTLRRHRNCPERRRGAVPPHWHISSAVQSLCTFSLYFKPVFNIIPNWTWPQISTESIISERAQSSGRCRGCPRCW